MAEDRPFWLRLDRHLPEEGFARKVRDREGYVLEEDGQPAGLLRWNLFWDEIPFCTLLAVAEDRRGRGLGRALLARWESDMAARGHRLVMTSTRADERAQGFTGGWATGTRGACSSGRPAMRSPRSCFSPRN